ncbi:MAG: peptide-methionine (R)-S-oxide reductase [Akkermansiaceae bacterium]|jgi:peptide-methionine (R)-S-oxide reductase
MKKVLSLTLVVAAALGIFVYAQDKKEPVMSTPKEVPQALTEEDVSKISDAEWKKRLTPEQYRILRKSGTEGSNGKVYKEFKAQGAGTYFCAGCSSELFSSKEKFDSHCGWPSFYDPAKAKNVKSIIEADGSGRVEVRCKTCDGHLGHVFKGEGFNTPTDQRYCINGTVLKFVPAEAVEAAKKEMAAEAAQKIKAGAEKKKEMKKEAVKGE